MIREIEEELYRLHDTAYRDLQVKLIPTRDPQTMIGVRTPQLRKYAKQLMRDGTADLFLIDLPHRYFDEDQLHAFILSEIKDYHRCLEEVERFLPYIDNWATCDQLSPKVFQKHRVVLLEPVRRWLRSEHTYTVRFGIGMLMQHYLDEDFDIGFPEMVASVRSEEYYVKMMIAWYFATALAKQYDTALPFLEDRRLDPWTHNKTIRKALESYRVTPEHKAYLRTLTIKNDSK